MAKGPKITFIMPSSQVAIRFMNASSTAICDAAINLRATHFIAPEDGGWGVFEMRTAQRNTPVPGEWSINDPIKVFPNVDAAVMFAIAVGGR